MSHSPTQTNQSSLSHVKIFQPKEWTHGTNDTPGNNGTTRRSGSFSPSCKPYLIKQRNGHKIIKQLRWKRRVALSIKIRHSTSGQRGGKTPKITPSWHRPRPYRSTLAPIRRSHGSQIKWLWWYHHTQIQAVDFHHLTPIYSHPNSSSLQRSCNIHEPTSTFPKRGFYWTSQLPLHSRWFLPLSHDRRGATTHQHLQVPIFPLYHVSILRYNEPTWRNNLIVHRTNTMGICWPKSNRMGETNGKSQSHQ